MRKLVSAACFDLRTYLRSGFSFFIETTGKRMNGFKKLTAEEWKNLLPVVFNFIFVPLFLFRIFRGDIVNTRKIIREGKILLKPCATIP